MTTPVKVKNLLIGEGIPKICVPLTATKKEEILEEAKKAAEAGAQMVEWRADFFERLLDDDCTKETLVGLSDILGEIPLIFTVRTVQEGGSCRISTAEYVRVNLAAARSGQADLIDVQVFGDEEEKKELIKKIHEENTLVIASSHDFEKTDDRETLIHRFRQMDTTGADILKMAVMPQEFEDVAAIMQATAKMASEYTTRPLVAMAMGGTGSISRIAGEGFGSSITFATVGAASAPGQFPIKELRMMLEAFHEKK